MALIQKMMTQKQRKALPALYETDGQGMDAKVVVRYFSGGRTTNYITEYDGNDTMFGYTINEYGEGEWGYISLSELETHHRSMIMGRTERDAWFSPKTLREALTNDGYEHLTI